MDDSSFFSRVASLYQTMPGREKFPYFSGKLAESPKMRV
jgi:hypothetical protein